MIKRLITMMCVLLMCWYLETHYTKNNCMVVEVNGPCVTVEDSQGYLWCYEVEGDAPACGTVVDVHMYNNNTRNNIYDDEVVAVH